LGLSCHLWGCALTTWDEFTNKVDRIGGMVSADRAEYIQVILVALGCAALDMVDATGCDCPTGLDCENAEHGAACWMGYYISEAGQILDMAKDGNDV
jgi:hypothetical protein